MERNAIRSMAVAPARQVGKVSIATIRALKTIMASLALSSVSAGIKPIVIQFQEHAPVNPVGMGHYAMNLVRMELTAKTARPVAGVRMAVHAAPLMANVSVLADGRVKCAPIHARMELGVPNALNVVPVTTMPVVITLTAHATACPAIEAINVKNNARQECTERTAKLPASV